MKGLINIHSENSRYDGIMNVSTICKRTKELGYEAIVLTDSGVLTGIDDFVKAAKEHDIKPIPGVLAYLKEDNEENRRQLALIALDDLGYTGIGKAVTLSNKNIDKSGYPLMTKSILESLFSPGKTYHGHVVATSGGLNGVLNSMLLEPIHSNSKIKNLEERKLNLINPDSINRLKLRIESNDEKLEKLNLERNAAMVLSKKPFKKKENALEKLRLSGDTEAYLTAAEELKKEKAESEKALETLEDVRVRISLLKKEQSSLKMEYTRLFNKKDKYDKFEEEIQSLKKNLIDPATLYQNVTEEAKYFEKLFGKNNFYIEIQYHGYISKDQLFEEEKEVMKKVAEISRDTGIPMVASTEARLPNGSYESIRAREIIQGILYAKKDIIIKHSKGDEQIFMKSEDDLKHDIEKVITKDEASTAISNAYSICERSHCEFNYGTHYPKFNQLEEGDTADAALRRMAENGIKKKFPEPGSFTKKYEDRLNYELGVISSMGYSDYFLIVQDFLQFGRKLGHLNNVSLEKLREEVKEMNLDELINYVDEHQEELGFSIGAGRGSAAGSLVAYLVGITNIIDPIKFDLLFERFLNKDRVSMPDVDSDISPEVRDLLIEYCKKRYGVQTVANIVTKGYMAPKGAIRNVARIIGLEKGKKAYYLRLSDLIAKKVPEEPGMNFEKCEENLRETFKINEDDTEEMKEEKKDINDIIDQALLVEGIFLNYGMHAAGVIIADGYPIDNYVPLMRDEKSGDMKVQCDMIQAEEIHGLLKFDFLGLRNLKIVTLTLRMLKKNRGIVLDVENLPDDPEVYENIFSTGRTGSVFQLESPGMKRMLKSFRPDRFEDIVALISLYRPGPMDFIPQYIESKFHPETIKYKCKQLEPILGKTYGCIIYQGATRS